MQLSPNIVKTLRYTTIQLCGAFALLASASLEFHPIVSGAIGGLIWGLCTLIARSIIEEQ